MNGYRSNGGMILTEKSRNKRKETCPSATLFTKNTTSIGLGLNSDLHGERPANKCLSTGTSTYYKTKVLLQELLPLLSE
jgi:hypothetical protein